MTSHNLQKMLAEANAVIDTISVHDVLEIAGSPDTVFVDIRETVERQQNGIIPSAVHAPRGFLEFIADPQGPMHNEIFISGKRFILFCATGGRSTLATKTLLDMGFKDVAHIAGGFAAWREAGGAVNPSP
ncbi:MAG: rhodanese-like domain-containing protein [Gammaproteobacteria bacterium]|nr:rhodanese-like domain-containing protein [Gammaproteobacteria bacterium]